MMKKRTYLGISIYALSMLIILTTSIALLGGALYRAKQTNPKEESDILDVDQTTDLTSDDTTESKEEEESQTDTESSIFQENDSLESETETDTNTDAESIEAWVVKEYMGQIGIFKPDGSLEMLLDTYVKTLPKADQALLGEGFEIQGRTQLNKILQDYGD